MRTARLLTISQHTLLGGVPARGVPAWGCTCWGVPAQGVYLRGGVPAGGVPAKVLSPHVNRMTDRCKNITLPLTSLAGGKNQKLNQGLSPDCLLSCQL